MTRNLTPTDLRACCDPASLPFADSRDIPDDPGALARTQPRAMAALDLALAIGGREYNVYLAGEPAMGRTHFARAFLDPAAKAGATPPDWLYVHNFDDPDRPRAVSLPAGEGRGFKTALAKAVADMREEIPARFEREAYLAQKQTLMRGYNADRETMLDEMEERAKSEGYNLLVDDQGAFTLYPLLEGKVVSDEEFERLEPELKKSLKAKGDLLLEEMSSALRKLSKEERGYRDREKDLERDAAGEVCDAALAQFADLRAASPAIDQFLTAMRADILDNIDAFMPQAQPAPPSPHGDLNLPEDIFYRYEANLFVDNGQLSGAPVVAEDHPTYFNLMGCIERESEMGALYTDFTLIKSGSLHRANGGFLIIRVDDLAANPGAWESLLRALRSGQARVEDPAEGGEHVRTRTIEPESIPLDLKIVLVGPDEAYEALLYSDERFGKLFKLKAHLQENMARSPDNVGLYLTLAGQAIRQANLLPFDRAALAALVDYASVLAEDQTRLSLKIPFARELMIEADALARRQGAEAVTAAHLALARKAREFRVNLYEEEYLEEYDREMIKVATSGEAVGKANGLSVRMFGDYAFGLPHQISCTVGVGHGGILDLEREAELGGPIHTKGMMILKSYLVSRFAQDKGLVMTGSLCFEQNYAGVEGDSASGAELAALLSALAETPIRLRYAMTGAVSQSGEIMAVGGVNEKIRGFFAVCRRRGLSGDQGVILPADNVVNLMLDDEVTEAVAQGRFHIHPVTTVEEAMEILTGRPAGVRGPDGAFPEASLYARVDARLARLAQLAPLGGGWQGCGRG
ncbi:MAG: putative ATP-dependent protease [Solidesulfovibrio magneticus str. Maddingley MBC34]|uniref:endopeptidase La n=1 Tax=Solidesulfovibrio magneticus str. Maddingley MBC34 TaxID=1206767 RepID=K6FHY1_9BACT|nr:MAG: putative ATP-dependent protease [Solidesulfovibrio magneticus str. Maddingley MBC34]